MRDEVRQLVALGPLPGEDAEAAEVARHEALLKRISKPVTDEDACALVKLFSRNGCYGLDWTLVHLVESAPGWPIEECLQDDSNEWATLLCKRIESSRHPEKCGRLPDDPQ